MRKKRKRLRLENFKGLDKKKGENLNEKMAWITNWKSLGLKKKLKKTELK